jgi:hypothetical protein
MEHRCGYRRTVNVSVLVSTRGGLTGKGTLCEVSVSGGRLTSSLPLPLHGVVVVQVGGSRRQQPSQQIEAEVVRRTDTGFGLEWTDFAPEAVRALFASAGAEIGASPVQMHPRHRGAQSR